jgi:hypothetical protein
LLPVKSASKFFLTSTPLASISLFWVSAIYFPRLHLRSYEGFSLTEKIIQKLSIFRGFSNGKCQKAGPHFWHPQYIE